MNRKRQLVVHRTHSISCGFTLTFAFVLCVEVEFLWLIYRDCDCSLALLRRVCERSPAIPVSMTPAIRPEHPDIVAVRSIVIVYLRK